jgi:hypothetical protein
MQLSPVLALLAVALVACAETVPKAELDRCKLGVADGNDSYAARQGAACGRVAKRLAADDQPAAALAYARKACELEDAPGCVEYLEIVRGQPSLAPEELQRARVAGEKACSGLVIANDGADARPLVCIRTAELYMDLSPKSSEDAGRMFVRACKLGDDRGCSHARSLGVDPDDHAAPTGAKPTRAPSVAQPLPAPTGRVTTVVTPQPAPACHEMRPCVSLDLQQRNVTEVVGSIANKCDRPVICTWCPVRSGAVDKTQCRKATLAAGEARAGRDAGLWYDGSDAMAYDCMDATDDKGCLGM